MKLKKKSVKYPQLLKIRKLSMIKMKKVLLTIMKIVYQRLTVKIVALTWAWCQIDSPLRSLRVKLPGVPGARWEAEPIHGQTRARVARVPRLGGGRYALAEQIISWINNNIKTRFSQI